MTSKTVDMHNCVHASLHAHTVQLRGMRTSKRVPNATWTRSTPGVNAFHFRRAFNETHSLEMANAFAEIIFIVFVLNTIIVPFKSMDKGNQKGLTSDKRWVYTCNLIPCQIIYWTEEFISVNVIRYHYTKLIAGYIGSFKDINQHNFESNIIIPEDLKQQATDLFPSREG